jgi:hypothetical protein
MPKCPYCRQTLALEHTRRNTMQPVEEVNREIEGFVKKEIMYSYLHCDSILGFGFFIGGLLTGRP